MAKNITLFKQSETNWKANKNLLFYTWYSAVLNPVNIKFAFKSPDTFFFLKKKFRCDKRRMIITWDTVTCAHLAPFFFSICTVPQDFQKFVFLYTEKLLHVHRQIYIMNDRVHLNLKTSFSYLHWVAIVLACPQPAQQICLCKRK